MPSANIRIYQKSGTTLALVDEIAKYESAEFTRSRSGFGSFTITIGLDAPKATSFVKRYFVGIGTDVRRMGVITGLSRSISSDGKKVLIVTGLEAKALARQRRIIPAAGSAYYTLTDDAETAIRTLITNQMGTSAATKRQMGFVNVPTTAGLGGQFAVSARYENLGDYLKQIAEASNMGWDFRINTATAKLDVYTYLGTDRRSSQSTNPRAIFAVEWNSLASGTVDENISDLANLVLVAGQGEGSARTVQTVYSGTEPESNERHEDFVDARDLATTTDLNQRGAEKLMEKGYTTGIEVEANQTGLVFGTDYDVGDRVTVKAFDLEADCYITAVTERWSNSGYRVNVAFDKPQQTAVQNVNGRLVTAEETIAKIDNVQSTIERGVLSNVGIDGTVGSNALTVSLKQKDGSTDPGYGLAAAGVLFRSATLTAGAVSWVYATAALSVVLSSGSTLGHTSALADFVYVYAINNAGAIELALSASNHFDEGILHSTTAEGGAGGADSRTVLYSTTARTNVAIRLIGRLGVTEATAGTWATAPASKSVAPFNSRTIVRVSATNQTASGAGATIAVYNTESPDPFGAYSTSTGIFTAPLTKIYRLTATLVTTAIANGGIRLNGSGSMNIVTVPASTRTQFSWEGRLNAGETIEVHCSNNLSTDSTGTLFISEIGDI